MSKDFHGDELVSEEGKKVVDDLVTALGAFVKGASSGEIEKKDAPPLRGIGFVALALFAINATALIWALSDVFDHPYVALLIKSSPVIFSVTVTAYTDRLKENLTKLAQQRWFFLANLA